MLCNEVSQDKMTNHTRKHVNSPRAWLHPWWLSGENLDSRSIWTCNDLLFQPSGYFAGQYQVTLMKNLLRDSLSSRQYCASPCNDTQLARDFWGKSAHRLTISYHLLPEWLQPITGHSGLMQGIKGHKAWVVPVASSFAMSHTQSPSSKRLMTLHSPKLFPSSSCKQRRSRFRAGQISPQSFDSPSVRQGSHESQIMANTGALPVPLYLRGKQIISLHYCELPSQISQFKKVWQEFVWGKKPPR